MNKKPYLRPEEKGSSQNSNFINLPKPGFLSCVNAGAHIIVAYQAGRDGNIPVLAVNNKKTARDFLNWFKNFLIQKKIKPIAVALAGFDCPQKIGTRLWLDFDAVSHFYEKTGGNNEALAQKLLRRTAAGYDKEFRPKIRIYPDRKVKVSTLTGLDAYRSYPTELEFDNLEDLASRCRERKLKVAFINATAAGGGVAIMRHALMRLYRLLEVDFAWYVLRENREIFHITKKKIHNVLQGVCPPDAILTTADKRLYQEWSYANAQILRDVFRDSDLIVIDDPQPAGLIPYIKKAKRRIKIIYRSHIQIRADLIDTRTPQQCATWDFLWRFIRRADLFVSHPIPEFVPQMVDRGKLLYLPAMTDPLDGLNKHLGRNQRDYYFDLFDRLMVGSGQAPLDRRRPYLIQIARFDPSKGIPDVVESFRRLRRECDKNGWPASRLPQLIIAGNGSVDDPEGAPIYDETRRILGMDTYAALAADVKVARLPHYDQLLNALMEEATIALQLSHREGFEFKVTEALLAGKPVIAYKTGGIPLQIRHARTGYLVKPGNTKQVAKYAFRLLSDKNFYRTMSKAAATTVNHDFLALNNAVAWLYLALEITDKKPFFGNGSSVHNLVRGAYGKK